MADVVNVAQSLSPSQAPSHSARPRLGAWDPCADSNNDGKTDINDVAFSCQVFLGHQAVVESVREVDTDDASFSEVDCEEDCLRV